MDVIVVNVPKIYDFFVKRRRESPRASAGRMKRHISMLLKRILNRSCILLSGLCVMMNMPIRFNSICECTSTKEIDESIKLISPIIYFSFII